MDRQIVYPGAIPLDTDLLGVQRNTMVALGYLAQATLGNATVADGLACLPTQPASLGVSVGPGSITQLGVVDTTPFGSFGAASQPLLRIGVNLDPTSFTMSAPAVPGQAINYLIQASLLEADASPVVLPYYNAADPSKPYTGPGNLATPQNTQRLQTVQLQMKAGAPGVAGAQGTPSVDAGWVGLYVITVAFGQTVVTASNIAVIPAAPFVNWKLPQLTPGTRHIATFTPTTQGNWAVPAGVSAVKVRLWGGGGSGGNGFGGAGGGGAGGGHAEGFYAVAPGQSIAVIVGNGGTGAGTNGGPSSFGGGLISASGGKGGANGSATGTGAGSIEPGSGVGSALGLSGSNGGDAFQAPGIWGGGQGGGAFGSAGGVASMIFTTDTVPTVAGRPGAAPGGGGSGGIGSGLGGAGGNGLVVVEW